MQPNDRTAGIKWKEEPLTRVPQSRAWGVQRGSMHAETCSCRTCEGLRRTAAAELLQKIPRLSEILGERVPWNLQTWRLRGLYGRFFRLREKLIAEVEAGRVPWPVPAGFTAPPAPAGKPAPSAPAEGERPGRDLLF